MKYNIFITGKPGSGKSCLARWIAKGFDQPWAGYETLKTGKCPAGPLFSLCSVPGGEKQPVSQWEDGAVATLPETFETLGANAICQARQGSCPIVLLDEIGRVEKDDSRFITEIYKTLSSEKTVIAVVKKEPLAHLERLKTVHNGIWVDLDNCSPMTARQNLAGLLWPEKSLRWGLDLRLLGVGKSFGPEAMRLLQGVERTCSLQKAADQMGMAYSKAWTLTRELENEWGFALVESKVGGEKGGETRLTDQGAQLLFRYVAMVEKVEQAAQQAFAENFNWEHLF